MNLQSLFRCYYVLGYISFEKQVEHGLRTLVHNQKGASKDENQEEDEDEGGNILFQFDFAVNNIDIKLADLHMI